MPVRVTLRAAAGAPGDGAGEEPLHGLAEIVLLRDDVEVHRAVERVEGEIVLPELAPGVYNMHIRGDRGDARARFEVLPAARLPEPPAGLDVELRLK